MKFANLSDAESAYNKLAAEIETMMGIQGGITVSLISLIAKHPDYLQFQLHLTSMVELADSELWKTLTKKSQADARDYVESLQQIREGRGQIRPLDI